MNPFEVLRLDPDSPEEAIVRAAGLLRQRAPDEGARNAIRQAVQALTASAKARALHALLAHPAPQYSWPALDRFVAAFRRPPAPAGAGPVPPDLDEWASLLSALLAEEVAPPPAQLEEPGVDEAPDEVARQTAEALWKALVSDPRA
jgi:hypothetical protein